MAEKVAKLTEQSRAAIAADEEALAAAKMNATNNGTVIDGKLQKFIPASKSAN